MTENERKYYYIDEDRYDEFYYFVESRYWAKKFSVLKRHDLMERFLKFKAGLVFVRKDSYRCEIVDEKKFAWFILKHGV